MVNFCTSMTEFNALKAGDKLFVADFTASWCPPCKMIAPKFARMAEENPDCVFVKVDVDDAQEIASEAGIEAMPTFKFYKNGQDLFTIQGADETKLKAKISELK